MENMKKKSVQQNMIYNTVGSLVYYFGLWAMTIIVKRLSGFGDVGIFNAAINTTAPAAVIGLFNIRSFQVSDLKGEYLEHTYIYSRFYTNLLSFLICIILCFAYGYDIKTSIVILLFMVYKLAEAAADVYYGLDQKNERLDYAGISLTIRGIGTFALFFMIYAMTKNLVLAIAAMAVFSFAVILVYDRRVSSQFLIEKRSVFSMFQKSEILKVKNLLIICAPLAIVSFLNNLSLTIPKTFLERYYGHDIFGIYASVSSPTVVVQLAATTLFAPLIPAMALRYQQGEKKEFVKIMVKFFSIILGLTIIALIGAAFIASPVLILLFKADIAPYTNLFLPMLIIAALIAVNASFFSICTLMREIKLQYLVGIIGLLVAFLLSVTIVKQYDLVGTIIAFIGTLVVQIAVQIILVIRKVQKM